MTLSDYICFSSRTAVDESEHPDWGFVDVGDIKKSIIKINDIITKGCLGTSANCYLIKKEVAKEFGDALLVNDEVKG